MKIYLEKSNGEWFDDFVYICVRPLKNMGANIVSFDELYADDFFERTVFNKEDIMIGSVEATNIFFKKIDIEPPKYLGYPNELKKYLGRKIYKTIFDKIPKEYPYFIKPAEDVKLFTGSLIESDNQLTILKNYMSTEPLVDQLSVYISEPIEFISEYRCFIHKGIIKGIKHYQGDHLIFPDGDMINKMVNNYISSPVSYTLDVGITNNGKTHLIEVNDFWALGSYGLDGQTYYVMLRDRMNEIKCDKIKKID